MIDLAQCDSTLRQLDKPVKDWGCFTGEGKLVRVFTSQSSAIRYLLNNHYSDNNAFIKPI